MIQPPTAWSPPPAGVPVDPAVQAPPVTQAVHDPLQGPTPRPGYTPPVAGAAQAASATPMSPGPQHAAPPSQPARPGQPAQPNPTAVEAPAPAPPARAEHGLPVTTTDSMPGRTITAVIGDVIGVVSRSRELGGNREIQSRTLLTERQQAVTRMARMALGAHADAVVGMRFDTCQVSAEVIEVVAYGTAVRLAEAPGFSAPGIDLPRPSTGASATHPPTPPTV
ncbi:heavy metal-binding domain-containing protein [Raineyella sp.]|uniref:heavy metal-binding domain-containing protein n=1 Tax=Raineyella sp. TaxID=1911550 RepID=UPI002B1FBDE8|nr:heavy metal-binding domain-containing protein [Raineyella sp.]MEA5154967.1 heavy metal-binding domain-containing protein [Raineyella sp.]